VRVIGQVLGSYRIVHKLGEGGMGAVYVAEHQRIVRRVAIKVLHPDLARNEQLLERFFAEARAISLIQHSGIVQVIDCAQENGCAYIVMELLEGESLAGYLQRQGPLVEGGFVTAIRIGEQIASAVQAAHSQQVVHRDLKPDNVFLASAPGGPVTVKILDFGIAKLAAPDSIHRTSTGALLGTPIYMSPEQCRSSGKVDLRTDIYSLGCILFEMIVGRPPFLKEGAGELIAAHIAELPPSVASLARQVPPQLDALVLATLAKDPGERPLTMDEVGQRLRALRDPALDDRPILLPATPSRLASTQPLPVAQPATVALPDAASMRPRRTTLGASAHAVPARTRSRSALGAALGALVVVGGAAALVIPRLRQHEPTTVAAAAVPAVARSTARPAEEWVTIDVEQAPAGMVALLGGQRMSLPFRLPKGSPPRELRLEAPGFEPRVVHVDGTRDRALVLDWNPVVPEPNSPRPARVRTGKRSPVKPESPAPEASPLDMKLQ
jgi:serine/threonine protein kinase